MNIKTFLILTITLPAFTQTHQTEIANTIKNSIGIEFIKIPSGKFIIETNRIQKQENISITYVIQTPTPPQLTINMKSFWISKTEITQEQWQKIIKINPSKFKNNNNPVENVSWLDVKNYISEINKNDELYNYRLPTESEWEYACTTRDEYIYKENIDVAAWYSGNSRSFPHNVAKLCPNKFGLFDMFGNVAEWCEDTWHKNYDGLPTDGSAWVDENNDYKIIRGGSWDSYDFSLESNIREKEKANKKSDKIGFRLVMFPINDRGKQP